MATKKTTKANSSPSISRNGTNFKVTWKINDKDIEKQEIRWRHKGTKSWSGWTSLGVNAKTTSYTIAEPMMTMSPYTYFQVQTRIRRWDYKWSDYSKSSSKYEIKGPPKPSLSVSAPAANQTTFTWSSNKSDTSNQFCTWTWYRTKGSSGWTEWDNSVPASPKTYTDTATNIWREFQIYNTGTMTARPSSTVTAKHWIGKAPVATWQETAVSKTKRTSYYDLTLNINLSGSTLTIDKMVPQYYIGVPAADMSCPPGSGFTDGRDYMYKDGATAYSLAVNTNDLIDEDECLWARVKTVHDSQDTFSTAYRVLTGKLKAPTATISMSTPQPSGFSVDIDITNVGSQVPGIYTQVFLEKASNPGVENYILIGTMPNGTTTDTITSTLDITGETGYSIHIRNVSADGETMTSDYYSYHSSMPTVPTLNSVSLTTTPGKVYVTWTNTWSDATGTIIAWTDDPDNWMSNEDPDEYEIHELASSWFITGLETGKTWYFRIRSIKEAGNNINYSSWSDDMTIDLSSAPAIPTLYLSENVITEDGMVTAYWSYMTTDGTPQTAANVVEATYAGGVWTYGNIVGSTSTAQHVDIYAQDNNWTNGSVVFLALQTRSGSGGQSEYSTPIRLVIAEKPTVTLACSDFQSADTRTEYFLGDGVTDEFECLDDISSTPTATVDGSAVTVASYTDSTVTLASAPAADSEVAITYTTTVLPVLDAMPFDVSITTSSAVTLSVAIERAEDYPMTLPDNTETAGSAGETICLLEPPAEALQTLTITNDDLIGRLDDGAMYYLMATVKDEYGQTVDATPIKFMVHWLHQAYYPLATLSSDTTNYIATIKPAPDMDYYVAGDTCDIYRLSIDKPELIVKNAEFGTQYVDPFPAFGEYSGYKIVTITENDDFITPDNEVAAFDTTQGDGSYTQLNPETMVIDFGDSRVELPYNIGLSNTWTKDFKRTPYLGGSVVGDYNSFVLHDLTASTVIVRSDHGDNGNVDTVMRDLSRFTGTCHVRTPDGSSFAASVQVKEDQSFDSPVVSYSLTINRVDSVGYDGMTYAEWSELQ